MAINIELPSDKLTFKKKAYKDHREYLKFKPAGVYFLFDINDELLYVGKTKNFRNRLMAHFRGRDLSAEFYRRIDYVTVYFADVDYEREMYETFAINTFKPTYNRAKTYFVDKSEEINEIDESIRELEEEKADLLSDMCDDGAVDRDFETNDEYLTGIYFHNRDRLEEIEREIKILKRRKSFL